MDTLYSWKARRAGGRITIEHSCGKIAGIDSITSEPANGVHNGRVIASHHDGRRFALHVA